MDKIERIEKEGKILAIIVRKGIKDELAFATPEHFPFQLGVHNRKADVKIQAHSHPQIDDISTLPVQEFFYIISGKVKIALYDDEENKVQDIILEQGDSVIIDCGHGFEFLEDTNMIELRQGPYRGKEKEKKMIE